MRGQVTFRDAATGHVYQSGPCTFQMLSGIVLVDGPVSLVRVDAPSDASGEDAAEEREPWLDVAEGHRLGLPVTSVRYCRYCVTHERDA